MHYATLSRRLGSSPRVRGKRYKEATGNPFPGLIPARAGKTEGGGSRGSSRPAHPRACGENLYRCKRSRVSAGSSPRVRGKLMILSYAAVIIRLIPARAGKTSRSRCGPRSTGAHPRACGENGLDEWPGAPAEGSSPRVRGKLFVGALDQFGLRLIPARAGKTPCPPSPTRPPAAHPRACGENPILTAWVGCTAGSSPRVRGKPSRRCAPTTTRGLIPARAGKPHRRPARGPAHRLIPARAGKTALGAPHWSPPRAHPRACGENLLEAARKVFPEGSSPRVRGKPAPHSHFIRDSRLIPARAGKT